MKCAIILWEFQRFDAGTEFKKSAGGAILRCV
jgi:hypothetical protein